MTNLEQAKQTLTDLNKRLLAAEDGIASLTLQAYCAQQAAVTLMAYAGPIDPIPELKHLAYESSYLAQQLKGQLDALLAICRTP